MFKNRPDMLVYRSVVYDPEIPDTSDLKLLERNYGREVKIKKMTQKFEIDDDPKKPPSSQIRKTEFNLKSQKGMIYIHYHFQQGKITASSETYNRAEMIGNATAKMDNVGEKDQEESKEQQT